MPAFEIRLITSAASQLVHLERRVRARIVTRLERLADEPRPPGSTKLSPQDFRRIRVGHYRIIYRIEDEAHLVVVLVIGHGGQAYGNLDRLDPDRIGESLARWRGRA